MWLSWIIKKIKKKEISNYVVYILGTVLALAIVYFVIVFPFLGDDEPKSELEIKYELCISTCKGMVDSGGWLEEGCENNKNSLSNLNYWVDYCNCLKKNDEADCVNLILE